MRLDRQQLSEEAQRTGFREEVLEKVILLTDLLDSFAKHNFLEKRFVLKGGTALNLFYFDLLRLSVDIDLNYIGSVDRAVMREERIQIEKILQLICQQKNYQISKLPRGHAGGKAIIKYQSLLGNIGNLQVDINYMFRTPLLPTQLRTGPELMGKKVNFQVLDICELAAGKLAALFERNASRDLYDAYHLLTNNFCDMHQLRKTFIAYGAMCKRDWRTISLNDIEFNQKELKNKLIPVLRKSAAKEIQGEKKLADTLIQGCKEILSQFFPFTKNENLFLERLLEYGEVMPTLLTDDEQFNKNLMLHPAILRKVTGVKAYGD